MLEFRILTSILTAYGKVINLKHETVLKHNFLETLFLKWWTNLKQYFYTDDHLGNQTRLDLQV